MWQQRSALNKLHNKTIGGGIVTPARPQTPNRHIHATSQRYVTWTLDKVCLKIDGRMTNLWRAVDAEGDVLGVLVQTRRNTWAALKLMRKFKKKYGFAPDNLVTDDL